MSGERGVLGTVTLSRVPSDGLAVEARAVRFLRLDTDDDRPAGKGRASVKSTVFTFQHKVFQAPGAVFRKDHGSGVISLHLVLGRVVASITLAQLTKTFAIGADTPDGRLLRAVEDGLRFIREIRPGDSVPDELLDGSATWAVERRHAELVRGKVLVKLVRWATQDATATDAGADVLALAESPEIKGRVNEAFAAATRELGLDEADRIAVPTMMARLTGELAQIEALREKVAGYVVILKKLKDLALAYRNDTRLSDTIKRVMTLIAQPFATLRRQFQLVETHTAEIISCLRDLTTTLKALREIRDGLREFVLLWGDLDATWRELVVERGPTADALISRTYRFAATHYLLKQSWAD